MAKFFPIVVLVLATSYFFLQMDDFAPESVRGKRVLITGASSGIGEQLAYQYAKLGARLLVTARRDHLLQKVVARCKELGATQVERVAADMAEPGDRSRVVERTAQLLGGLDHLVLNHATFRIDFWTGAAENLTTLQTFLQVNFLSFVDVASKAYAMLASSSGSIGVVSSLVGKIGHMRMLPYVSSKFALQGFFTSWRQELNHRQSGVSVTMCILGLIETEAAVRLLDESGSGLDMSAAASPEDTALAIIKGVTTRRYEIYHPRTTSFLVNLHKFFPDYVQDHLFSLPF